MSILAGLLLRGALTYLYLLFVVRLAGKRTIAQGTPFDFIVALVVSDLPDNMIYGQVPVANAVVAIGTIMLLHGIVVYGVFRSRMVDRVIDSVRSRIIEKGKPVKHNLAFERVGRAELDAMLREQDVRAYQDLEHAWLETSGKVSVQRTAQAERARKKDVAELREAGG
jgi:uncharacterized membrane protein YcaP (DUF421 family)